MRQLIIARKDLEMSPGKLVAQVSHASMAFIANEILKNTHKVLDSDYRVLPVYHKDKSFVWYRHPKLLELACKAKEEGKEYFYIKQTGGEFGVIEGVDMPEDELPTTLVTKLNLSNSNYAGWSDIINEWFKCDYTKVICGAKNKNQLLKVIDVANDLGLGFIENRDYFIIRDRCYTELQPEEEDEHGNKVTITCIGFKPLPDDICKQLSKKYQLY